MATLESLLSRRTTTRPRFRWDVTRGQAESLLLAACRAEVESRRMEFVNDAGLKENISRLAAFMAGGESRRSGVMLCGVCGNGKSTVLGAFGAVTSMLAAYGYCAQGAKIKTVEAVELADLARDADTFRALRSSPMLAIEDLGREAAEVSDYGNVSNPVGALLEYRYKWQLFTFITTNLTAGEIRGKYGDRLADRFNEMLEVIVFRNGSYRR